MRGKIECQRSRLNSSALRRRRLLDLSPTSQIRGGRTWLGEFSCRDGASKQRVMILSKSVVFEKRLSGLSSRVFPDSEGAGRTCLGTGTHQLPSQVCKSDRVPGKRQRMAVHFL